MFERLYLNHSPPLNVFSSKSAVGWSSYWELAWNFCDLSAVSSSFCLTCSHSSFSIFDDILTKNLQLVHVWILLCFYHDIVMTIYLLYVFTVPCLLSCHIHLSISVLSWLYSSYLKLELTLFVVSICELMNHFSVDYEWDSYLYLYTRRTIGIRDKPGKLQ